MKSSPSCFPVMRGVITTLRPISSLAGWRIASRKGTAPDPTAVAGASLSRQHPPYGPFQHHYARMDLPRASSSYRGGRPVPPAYFSTQSHPPHDDTNETSSSSTTLATTTRSLLETTAVGTGQVIFLPAARAGYIILGSLALTDPFLAVLAGTGAGTSTAVARRLSLSPAATTAGLLSYNGCLVGCASAVFLPSAAVALPTTLAGATAATLLTAAWPHLMSPAQQAPPPQWTWAFNVVTLTILLPLHPLAKAPVEASAANEAVTLVASSPPVVDLLVSPLTALAQIFVVESAVTGAGILLALASVSPRWAGQALLGSAVGSAVGVLCCGAPVTQIAAGLWGYNAALTALGVGVFFVPNRASWALVVGGAAATTAVQGACQPLLMQVAGSPCLTLPFCLTMTACYALAHPVVPGLLLAGSEEKNE